MYDERWSDTDVYRFYVVKMVVGCHSLINVTDAVVVSLVELK
jgi:hypothetical protein